LHTLRSTGFRGALLRQLSCGQPLVYSGGSLKLLMIPVAALVIALYLWTPKTGKGVAIYGGIVLAMLIVYFALRG
jgi:hypothetical protein